jgi:uncharacterized protein (DUF4213/DUF364 family)
MNVIDDIIASIQEDSPVSDIRACVFWTAVVSRHCGLASTIRDDAVHHAKVPVAEAGSLLDKTALDFARLVQSDSLPEASIGMAAINSLIDIDVNRCTEQNASEILKKKGAGKNVAIVGHFPFVSRLRDIAEKLWVLEKHPAEGDLSEEQAEHILPQADIIGMTGTTLINHSFESLISLCKDKFVVLLGPSTPLTPVLFDYGVDVLSGITVTDRDTVLRMISQGASFKQLQGVRLLTMTAQNR